MPLPDEKTKECGRCGCTHFGIVQGQDGNEFAACDQCDATYGVVFSPTNPVSKRCEPCKEGGS